MSRTLFTYAAYDAGLPCRNKACKSHGLPHPNCRCYGGLPESPNSATQMVLPNGRWGRDPSSFAIPGGAGGSSSPTAVEPGEPKGPGSGGVPIGPGDSETAGNSLTTGDHSQIGPDSNPIARDISIDAGDSKTAGDSNTAPVNAPFDYAQTEATETDITPSGTNKPSTGFGIGHLVAGAGLATLGLGMMGMNFFKRKKAPKEKDSDYEDGVMALAEGGEVGNWQAVDHYCQTCMPHRNDCEYFVEGGEVGAAPTGLVDEATGQPYQAQAPTAPAAPEASSLVDEATGLPYIPGAAPEASSLVDEATGLPYTTGGAPVIEEKPFSHADFIAGNLGQAGLDKLAQAEAFVKGFIGGPAVTGAELALSHMGIPGLSARDQQQRDELAGTGTARALGTAVSLRTGYGLAGALSKTIGGTFVKDAIAGGVFAALNEGEKALIDGEDNDLLTGSSLISIGGQALLSGTLGNVGRSIAGLKDADLGTKFKSAALGFSAQAAHPNDIEMVKTIGSIAQKASADFKVDLSAYKAGGRLADSIQNMMGTSRIYHAVGTLRDYGITAAIADFARSTFGKAIANTGLQKMFGPTFFNYLSHGGGDNLAGWMNHAGSVIGGADKLNKSAVALLKGSTSEFLRTLDLENSSQSIEKMHKAVDSFVPEQEIQNSLIEANNEASQGFAEGGQVESKERGNTGFSSLVQNSPEQAMALQMARGRMSTYLRSLQPQQQTPSLSFDSPPDTREQKRTYEKALLIAAEPLSVFGHIAKGTLEPEHIQHLNAIYPEVSNQMQKKLTENIMLMQLSGEKPSYKTRQGLSMLLGAPLSSEFIPANIQAAQAVFIPPEANQQPGAKPTKLKQSLSKSAKSHMTDDQSRQFRMQKQ